MCFSFKSGQLREGWQCSSNNPRLSVYVTILFLACLFKAVYHIQNSLWLVLWGWRRRLHWFRPFSLGSHLTKPQSLTFSCTEKCTALNSILGNVVYIFLGLYNAGDWTRIFPTLECLRHFQNAFDSFPILIHKQELLMPLGIG